MAKNTNNASKIYYIDATNVCYWDTPFSLNVLLKLIIALKEQKHNFYCVFDANTIHKLPENERKFLLDLLRNHNEFFHQVTGGKQADDYLLEMADQYNASVISNDNYNSSKYDKYKWKDRKAKPRRLFMGEVMHPPHGSKHLILSDLNINVILDESTEELVEQFKQMLNPQKIFGTVKFFNKIKNWGRITYHVPSPEELDIYFHISECNFSETEKGEPVSFYLSKNNRGPCAESIELLTAGNTDQLNETIAKQEQTIKEQGDELAKLQKQLEGLQEKNNGAAKKDASYSGKITSMTDKSGWIQPDDASRKPIFFYKNYVVDRATLPHFQVGQHVEYRVQQDQKGYVAKPVRLSHEALLDIVSKKEPKPEKGKFRDFGKMLEKLEETLGTQAQAIERLTQTNEELSTTKGNQKMVERTKKTEAENETLKQQAAEAESQLAELTKTLESQKAGVSGMEQEYKQYRNNKENEITQLRNDKDRLKAQRNELQAQLKDLNAKLENAAGKQKPDAANDAGQSASEMEKQIDRLRKEKNAQIEASKKMLEAVSQLTAENKRLKSKKAQDAGLGDLAKIEQERASLSSQNRQLSLLVSELQQKLEKLSKESEVHRAEKQEAENNEKKRRKRVVAKKPATADVEPYSFFDTPEKRAEWWDGLEEQWHKAFNVMAGNGETTEMPKDAAILKILKTARLSFFKASKNELTFKLSNLSGLTHLTNISMLNVAGHKLENLDGLESLKRLSSLNCNHNKINDLGGVDKLPLLKKITCTHNRLTVNCFTVLKNLPNLVDLDISGNGFTKPEAEVLKTNPKLKLKV